MEIELQYFNFATSAMSYLSSSGKNGKCLLGPGNLDENVLSRQLLRDLVSDSLGLLFHDSGQGIPRRNGLLAIFVDEFLKEWLFHFLQGNVAGDQHFGQIRNKHRCFRGRFGNDLNKTWLGCSTTRSLLTEIDLLLGSHRVHVLLDHVSAACRATGDAQLAKERFGGGVVLPNGFPTELADEGDRKNNFRHAESIPNHLRFGFSHGFCFGGSFLLRFCYKL